MRDALRASELARLRSDLEARAADVRQGAGLRQLRQIMVRVMRGEAAMRLEIWRTDVRMAAYASHRSMQAALEGQMMAQGQEAGLRQLRQIMMRMMRGGTALRVEIWRTGMRDALRASELARLRGELESRMVDVEAGGAMRQLRQMLVRLSKGEMAMRVEVWRSQMRVEAASMHQSSVTMLKQQLDRLGYRA